MKSLQENSILIVVMLRFSETASSGLRFSSDCSAEQILRIFFSFLVASFESDTTGLNAQRIRNGYGGAGLPAGGCSALCSSADVVFVGPGGFHPSWMCRDVLSATPTAVPATCCTPSLALSSSRSLWRGCLGVEHVSCGSPADLGAWRSSQCQLKQHLPSFCFSSRVREPAGVDRCWAKEKLVSFQRPLRL